jgi:hypothetical protein
MKSAIVIAAVIAALGIIAMAAYALDRGIYVGNVRYTYGADCCPDLDKIHKRCRYLFVTGVSEIDARGDMTPAPHARSDTAALEAALKKPDNQYCRLFGH